MARQVKLKLTPFELEIMKVLWELGRASVREILELLPEKRRPAYTTVQTIVYRLEAKGGLCRVRKIGNAHVFEPVVKQRDIYRRLIDDLLNLFGGSPRPLMAHLLETRKLTLEDLRALEKSLGKAEPPELEQPAFPGTPNSRRKARKGAHE